MSGAIGAVGSLLGGGPSGDGIRAAGGSLNAPNQNNYQISGMNQYDQQLQNYTGDAYNAANNGAGNYNAGAAGAGLSNQAAATSLIGQTAMGQGPSLARANMQAGLNTQANQLASQAMTNQGNTAGGLSQRNLLNAQANAGNNMVQNAGTASVAEQLGAQSNYASAANAQTQGQMSNALNASNIGLAQNQQRLGAAQFGAQNMTNVQQQRDLQAQMNAGYDQANQQYGRDRTNVALQGVGADASQLGAIGKGVGNVVSGLTAMSDEATKENIRQGTATDGQIGKFLHGFMNEGKDAGGGGNTVTHQFAKDNPYSNFTPAMVTGAAGILPGGGAKYHYGDGLAAGGAGGALGGMLKKKMSSDPSGPTPTAPMASSMDGPVAGYGGGTMGGTPAVPSAVPQGEFMTNMGRSFDDPYQQQSDERSKTDKKGASDAQLSGFMDSMEPSTFKYKDQSYSPGQHMGVMAQDVDDSKIGADMVSTGDNGYKQINVPKALGATLASLAYLNEKVDALTGKKKGA